MLKQPFGINILKTISGLAEYLTEMANSLVWGMFALAEDWVHREDNAAVITWPKTHEESHEAGRQGQSRLLIAPPNALA